MKKILAAALLSLLFIAPVASATDNVTVYLAFVFYKAQNVQQTVIIGGATMNVRQEAFKAFLSGIDGATVQDFSVTACRPYNLSDLQIVKHWALLLFDWLFGLLAVVVACGIIYAVTTGDGLPR